MGLTRITSDGITDGTITGTDLATNIDLVDNQKLRLGNNQNLQIYYDASSYITNSTAGHLIIKTINGGSDINLECADDFFVKTGVTQNSIIARDSGQVELYHNNSKKFETTSGGCTVTGDLLITDDLTLQDNLLMGDTDKIAMGDSSDLEIYHDGSHSYIDNTGTGNLYIKDAGIVRVRTASFGVDNADGSEALISATANGAVELYHNNSKKFETTSSGGTLYGDWLADASFLLADNDRIKLGNGADLQIYHNGTTNIIAGFTASDINIESYFNADVNIITNSNHYAIKCISNAQVELYYDNSKKFETTSGGAKVSGDLDVVGHVFPNANNTYDLGTSGNRWRNVYTNDLNLSNEGGSNDVDGTWGSYTIQEGAENLFLVNKRNGKKYQFNLTEVS